MKDKHIAIIGVSHREEKYGFRIFRDLLKAGYMVNGINPSNGEVLGEKIYRNLKELGDIPDMVITVVPPEVTERIVDECKELGVKQIWMQPGSSSEEAVEKAKQYGISTTYNACFMVEQGVW